MSTARHDGDFWTGDKVGFVPTDGRDGFHGYALTRSLWMPEEGTFLWVGRKGKVVDNEWIEEESTYRVLTREDVIEGYELRWTKDAHDYKRGDILVGEGLNGEKVHLIYFADNHVERLGGGGILTGETGHGGLDFYSRTLSGVKVLKTTLTKQRFSDALQ